MTRSCLRAIALALLCMLGSSAAQAMRYNTLQPGRSGLSFIYRQMGAPMDGRFTRFSGSIDLDTAALANARAHLDIDVTSIDTGALDANAQITTKPWFNTAAFPRASFEMTNITFVKANQYKVSGTLSIKGKARPIIAPATLIEKPGGAVFEGEVPILRADFGIGEGEWADYGLVANEVKIRFSLFISAAASDKK